jgi:hypothetical protein
LETCNEIKARDLEIFSCSVGEVREFIETHHYSHNINGVKVSCCFKVIYGEELVGAVLFGMMSTTAWKKFSSKESEVLELRRFVLLDECGRNSESRVIGFTLRWICANMEGVKIIVSYADPNYGHSGIIYKASNFRYLGTSGADIGYKDVETGKIYHSRALRTKYKGDYKPFVKKLREKKDNGELEEIKLVGKHCYIYFL